MNLKHAIQNFNSITEQEKNILLNFFNDYGFFIDRFITIKNSIDIVRNFYKPEPFSYRSPLSKFRNLDKTISFNAQVTAFVFSSSFFDKKRKNNKDDRLVSLFYDNSIENIELLYKWRRYSLELFGYEFNLTKEQFYDDIIKIKNNFTKELDEGYIKDFIKVRNKVLNHHTYYKNKTIIENGTDNMLKAYKYIKNHIIKNLEFILNRYSDPLNENISDEIDLLRYELKGNIKSRYEHKITISNIKKEMFDSFCNHDMIKNIINNFTIISNHYNENDKSYILYFYEELEFKNRNEKFNLKPFQGLIDLLKLNKASIYLESKIVNPEHIKKAE